MGAAAQSGSRVHARTLTVCFSVCFRGDTSDGVRPQAGLSSDHPAAGQPPIPPRPPRPDHPDRPSQYPGRPGRAPDPGQALDPGQAKRAGRAGAVKVAA